MSLPRIGCLLLMLSPWAAGAESSFQDRTIQEKMQEGLNLAQSGDLEGAEALFQEIIREDTQHGSARLQLGRLALVRQDLDEAQKHLEIATTSPDQPQRLFLAWHLLGRVLYLKQDYAAAGRAFEKAVEKAPNFIPARSMLAEIAEREGDPFRALAAYREILELEPDNVEANARLANLARRMGAYDLAECGVRRALQALPEEGYLYYLLAVIQKGAGQNEAALGSCQRALELGFEEASLYVTLGDLYYETMQLSESIAALGKAVEMDPAAAESIASFALSSLTTEDFAALLTLLEKHLQAHPENLNTLYSLGVMYVRENELEKAKEYLLRLKELAPDHTQVHYNLGMIYFREGREEEGQAAMARFQELKAKEAEEFSRQNQAHPKRVEAEAAAAEGDPQRAIPIYLELIREGTAMIDDLIALGRAYASAGRPLDAFTWFERTLEVEPYNKEALEGLAGVSESLGRSEVAQRSRERLKLLSSPCAEKS